MDTIIERKSFEYMKSVNPIAQRIAEEIDIIKNNYKDWETLDLKTREQILNEKLMNPSLINKYEDTNTLELNSDFSSNFSWFSRSQLNLFSHIKVKNDKNKTPLKKTDILSPLKKNSTSKVPFDSSKQSDNMTLFSKLKNKVIKDENKPNEKIIQKGVAKPKNPPPPPPSKIINSEEKGLLEDQHADDIPKTGFDFLDNW